MLRVVAVLAAVVPLAGCADPPVPPAPLPPAPAAPMDAAPPGPPTADVRADAADGNRFAAELYKLVAAKEPGNVVLSPASVRTALAMLFAGSRGATADEVAKAARLTLPPDRLHAAVAGAADRLGTAGRERGYEFAAANALWPRLGEPLDPAFAALVAARYRGGSRPLDYGADPDGSRRTINRWVSDQTRDRVPELLKPAVITRRTTMVLTNAVFFRGRWAAPFDPKQTRPGRFTLASGEAVPAPMMRQTLAAEHGTTPGVTWLRLRYADCPLAFLVGLPDADTPLAAVEQRLTADTLAQATAGLTERRVAVAMPRLALRSHFALLPPLAALGLPTVGDWSPMNSSQITAVEHAATLAADEAGTVAAAATAVVLARSAPPSVVLDRPFLFALQDADTGAAVFLGRVVDPRE